MQLLHQVSQYAGSQLQQAAVLPPDVRLDFDAAAEEPPDTGDTATEVVKTSQRTVIALQGSFQAHEIVRRQPDNGGQDGPRRSAQLAGRGEPTMPLTWSLTWGWKVCSVAAG